MTRREQIEQAREVVATDRFVKVEKALSALEAAIDAALEATGRTTPEIVVTRQEFQWLNIMSVETAALDQKVRERHDAWLGDAP